MLSYGRIPFFWRSRSYSSNATTRNRQRKTIDPKTAQASNPREMPALRILQAADSLILTEWEQLRSCWDKSKSCPQVLQFSGVSLGWVLRVVTRSKASVLALFLRAALERYTNLQPRPVPPVRGLKRLHASPAPRTEFGSEGEQPSARGTPKQPLLALL